MFVVNLVSVAAAYGHHNKASKRSGHLAEDNTPSAPGRGMLRHLLRRMNDNRGAK